MNGSFHLPDQDLQVTMANSLPVGRSYSDGTGSSGPPVDPPPLVPQRFGRYRVDGVLGGGSFGVVCHGFDEELQRFVAIKVAHRHSLSLQEKVERFKAEARIVAGLDHAGIVPVYDVGETDDGRVFLVTKLIDGGSLAEELAKRRPDVRRAAEWIAEVAEALHYAHRQGVVHRDVKPSNILLDRTGRPLVADFGLAVHEDQQHRHRDEISGSPGYMAPEQVRGQSHFLDGRTDIWALGVLLYELLTGRRPFSGDSLEELFEEIQRRDPKPPRMLDDRIPAELERIALRCLEKNTTGRYCTAADLAGDLRKWCAGTGEKTGKLWVNRRPSRKVAVVLAASLLGVALAWRVLPTRDAGVHRPNAADHHAPAPLASIPVEVSLDGTIDVVVWSPGDGSRRGVSIRDHRALPLQDGDQIRIDAEVNRPAYVYLVWITPAGRVHPLYPWQPGDWTSRPETQRPIQRLSLPEQADGGWQIQGETGMETVVLLAREAPLADDFALQAVFEGFPAWQQPHPQALVRLEGEVRLEAGAGARIVLRDINFDTRRIDDPVLRARQFLEEQLVPHFSLVRAVSFANGGH